MALDNGDKALCAEIAREIIEKVLEKGIEQHAEACPIKKTLLKSKMFLIGICLGSGIGGGGTVLGLVKIFTHLQEG